MAKYNIFQGNNKISDVIYDVFGYEKNEFMSSSITSDMYFQAYFYLCNRFGPPKIDDPEYKSVMFWNFEVKQYTIMIELNSSFINFMIFGEGSDKLLSKNNFQNYGMRSPYWVRYWREIERNKGKFVNLTSKEKTTKELRILNRLWKKFSKLNNLNLSEWTEEKFNQDKQIEWYNYVKAYNEKVINKKSFVHLLSRETYSNRKTKHALRTLRQFLNNMLTPIYMRDCSFNIKGRCGSEYDRYINNIDIKRLNDEV